MTSYRRQRDRALAMRERYGFAAQQLTLYLALLDVWETVPAGGGGAGAALAAVPLVVKATREAGPEQLACALESVEDPASCLRTWFKGGDLPPIELFLARAATRGTWSPGTHDPDTTAPGTHDPDTSEAREANGGSCCPHCAGAAQLSFREPGGEPLVSGDRRLLCSRCWQSWKFSASTCPSCGESSGPERTIYSDSKELSHLRIEACATCQRYLIDVDRGREQLAVPEVDELVAVPLDLHAAELGLTKISPNLMGF